MHMRDVHQEMIRDQYVLLPLADAFRMKIGNAMMAGDFFIQGNDELLRAGASATVFKSLRCDGPFS